VSIDAGISRDMDELAGVMRSLMIDRSTVGIITAMTAQSLPCILLKGASFALWLYPAGAGRAYVDGDLLVPPDAWDAAGRVLAEHGFSNVKAGTAPDEQAAHAVPWVRRDDGMSIDLHRGLPGSPASHALTWSVLASHTERISVCATDVTALDAPAKALHLALHAAHHGRQSSQCMKDLSRALDELPMNVWAGAAGIARALDSTIPFAAGLRLLPEGAVVANRLDLPARYPAGIRARAEGAGSAALDFGEFNSRPGGFAKVRFVARNLFPTRAFMRLWHPLARRGPLGLAAAYLLRWGYVAWNLIPSYVAWREADR
jgi:putative nucleotidyltransferase-like protein